MHKSTFVLYSFAFLFTLLCACSQSNGDGKQRIATYTDSTKTCVMSDDSVLTIYYWDTEEGGTAPAIDATCFYRTESGKVKEESRPLLSLAYPESSCFHHEVKNIMTIHTTYDERIYLLYIWSKVGSNEFTHDLVALKVEGEELKAVNIFPGDRAGITIDADQIAPDDLNHSELH